MSSNTAAKVLLVVVVTMTACKRSQSSETTTGSTAPQPATAGPSFRKDVLPTLVTSCAGTDGCHGADATDRVNIDMRQGAAFRTLVRRPSEFRPSAMLVEPGNPARSFLIAKLTGTLVEGEGKAMPLDPQTGKTMEPTPVAGFVSKTLIPWIEQGAQDN